MSKNKKKFKTRIVVKPEDLHLRNYLHFEVQKNTKAQVFKSKKGKGSYTRKIKHKEELE